MTTVYAVLRGELVTLPKSGIRAKTGAVAKAGAMLTLTEASRRIAQWSPDWDCRFTRIASTGWQIILPGPALALRAMLLLQARLLSTPERLGTKVSVGVGLIEYMGPRSLSAATGPALAAAEQGLARMAKLSSVALAGADQPVLLQAILDLSDQIARSWTPEQAEAMVLALPPDNPTLETLSKRLGISKQAVSYRLTGAGLRAIRAALVGWEQGLAAPSATILRTPLGIAP